MVTPIYNYYWPQGEDLNVLFTYKEGPEGSEAPVDLTGYTVRMDITHPTTGAVLFTFNTAEQADPDEITLNVGGDGIVSIEVPRDLTLTGGELYTYIEADPPILEFDYDIFLRNPSNKQIKLFRGKIEIEPSYTEWS